MKVETNDPSLSVINTYSSTQPIQNAASISTSYENDVVKLDKEAVVQAVDKMNQNLEQDQRDVRYKIHEKTHRLMVQVINHKTQEIISTMPPEKILDIIASFSEDQKVAIDKKV